MGLFDFISDLFRPKEFREGVKEGKREIKKAKAKAKANSLTRGQLKEELAKGEKELASRAGDAAHLKIEADKYHKKLAKQKPGKSKWTMDDAMYIFSSVRSEADKDAKLAKKIESTGKVMETDSLERRQEEVSQTIGRAMKNIKEAEAVTLQLDNLSMAQDREVEALIAALEKKRDTAKMKPKNLEEEQALMEHIIAVNKDIITRVNNIMQLAGDTKGMFTSKRGILTSADHIATLLSVSHEEIGEAKKAMKDQIKYAEKLLGYQNSLIAAMRAFEESEKVETEKIQLFWRDLKKAQKKAA